LQQRVIISDLGYGNEIMIQGYVGWGFQLQSLEGNNHVGVDGKWDLGI
jgi:hypothetical protein